jgi:hypothetical protein
MRARNTFVRWALPRHRRLTFVTLRLGSPDPAVSRNRRRARTSTTTLTDFCNRHKARAHWRTIVTRRCAAFHGVALRLAALRRCVAAPTTSGPESAPCKARKPTLIPKRTSQSPAPALATLEVKRRFRRRSRLTSGSPRERTNLRKRARMPSCCAGSVRFYSTRSGRTRRAYTRLARAFYRPRNGAVR